MYLNKVDIQSEIQKKKKKLGTLMVITRAIMAYNIKGQMGHKKLIMKPPNPRVQIPNPKLVLLDLGCILHLNVWKLGKAFP